jgi:hypothetical protein
LKKATTLGILGTGHNSVLQLANGDYYIAASRFRAETPVEPTL